MFFRGVGSSLGPIITGVIYDATKSYDYACYLGGGILFLGGVINQLSHKLLLKQTEERLDLEFSEKFRQQLKYVTLISTSIVNIV